MTLAAEAPENRADVFHVNFNPQGKHREAARDCESEVFLKHFGNTAEQMVEEYGPYEDASVFVAITDPRETVVAAARFIVPSPAGLKTLNDVARTPWHIDGVAAAAAAGIDLTATWEVATISVRYHPPHRQLAAALYHSLFLACRANELNATVAIIDTVVRGMLESVGIVFRVLPGAMTAPYLGSPASTPVYAFCDEQIKTLGRFRPNSPRLITTPRLIATGIGLDGPKNLNGIAVPPLDHFRLQRR